MNGFVCHKKPNAFLDEHDIASSDATGNFDEEVFQEVEETGFTHDSVKLVRNSPVLNRIMVKMASGKADKADVCSRTYHTFLNKLCVLYF